MMRESAFDRILAMRAKFDRTRIVAASLSKNKASSTNIFIPSRVLKHVFD